MIALGSDHGGYDLKCQIEEYLEERSRTWETESESGRKDTASAAAMNEHKPLLLELLYCRQGCHMGDGVR